MARKKGDADTPVETAVHNGRIQLDGMQVGNGAQRIVDSGRPYVARIELLGSAPLLMHRWDSESVEAKGKAAKGSKSKKSDDLESYVWRDPERHIGLPATYLVAALSDTARSWQDPRSPRKSMRDLLRAIIVPLPTADFIWPFLPHIETWHYLDRRRVTVQRNAITRTRPALDIGWRIRFALQVNSPEYLSPEKLNQMLSECGRLNGLCDFRPSYGRFTVAGFTADALEE